MKASRTALYVGGVWIALSTLLKVFAKPKPAEGPRVAVASSSEPASDEEDVASTLPLELGEGDDRTRTAAVWPIDGSPEQALPAGTRIELLKDRPSHVLPPLAPACTTGIKCLQRIRVTEGPNSGLIAYVRSFQTQRAR